MELGGARDWAPITGSGTLETACNNENNKSKKKRAYLESERCAAPFAFSIELEKMMIRKLGLLDDDDDG